MERFDLVAEIKRYFSVLLTQFNKNALQSFTACDECDLWQYHFGLGTWIRTNLLQENNELYLMFLSEGITEKDRMSEIFIYQFYQAMKTGRE